MCEPWRKWMPHVCILNAILVCGCGGLDRDVGYVTGKVTLDGVPISDVRVQYQPKAGGRMSQGVTDAAGVYELMYVIDEPGALVGEHNVVLSTAESYLDEESGNIKYQLEMIPERYHGQLTAVVAEGDNQNDFELTSE